MIKFTCEAVCSWTFVCWNIFNQFQFHCWWLVCSHFLFLPGPVLEGCAFLKICPFLPFCCIQLLIVVLLSSVFLWYQFVVSPFSFLLGWPKYLFGFFSVRCNGKTGTNFLASPIILRIWGISLFSWWVWLKFISFVYQRTSF